MIGRNRDGWFLKELLHEFCMQVPLVRINLGKGFQLEMGLDMGQDGSK